MLRLQRFFLHLTFAIIRSKYIFCIFFFSMGILTREIMDLHRLNKEFFLSFTPFVVYKDEITRCNYLVKHYEGTSQDYTKQLPSDLTTFQLDQQSQVLEPGRNITTVATRPRSQHNKSHHLGKIENKFNQTAKEFKGLNSSQKSKTDKNRQRLSPDKEPPNPNNFFYNDLYDDTSENPDKYRNYSPRDGELPDAIYWRKFAEIRRLYNVSISPVRRPIILCWIMSDVKVIDSVRNAQKTWLSRCDIPLVFTSKMATSFPSLGLAEVASGRKSIAAKSRRIWEYLHDHYATKADFFVKADPDSYIFVDNLKRYLQFYEATEPLFMGHGMFMDLSYHKQYNYFKGIYTAGEGIVLSRAALYKLGTVIGDCPLVNGTAEDLKTTICLKMAGVDLMDTRDKLGREVFLPPFNLEHLWLGKLPRWYLYPYRKGLGICKTFSCLSPLPVVTHYSHKDLGKLNFFARSLNQILKLVTREQAEAVGLFSMSGELFV